MTALPWPRMMKLKTAAAYCELSQPAFMREVASGRLPPPVLLGGGDRWDLKAIDKALDEISGGVGHWRQDQPGLR